MVETTVSDFALIRKWSSHASLLVLTLDGESHLGMRTDMLRPLPCDVFQAPILDVIRHVLLLQHPSDLDEVIIHKKR